jgi:hypothetical protein
MFMMRSFPFTRLLLFSATTRLDGDHFRNGNLKRLIGNNIPISTSLMDIEPQKAARCKSLSAKSKHFSGLDSTTDNGVVTDVPLIQESPLIEKTGTYNRMRSS